MRRAGRCVSVCIWAAALGAVPAVSRADDGFVTVTFGGGGAVRFQGTVNLDGELLRCDVSRLPRDVRVQRAILRFPFRSDWGGHTAVKLLPVGIADTCLPTQPPDHRSLNATEPVKRWVADPTENKGLKIVQAGRARLGEAVLEVSYCGPVTEPLPVVTHLAAEHRDGQTFLTWQEPFDLAGNDAPTFEEFEKGVLEARAKRTLVYRIYRHTEPITTANLGQAALIREIPEGSS